jgi:manganese/iron transport system substrate-binding protein
MRNRARWLCIGLAILFCSVAAGCGASAGPDDEHGLHVDEMPSLSPVSLTGGEKLRVVATTSIVGDVVANVGGDRIDLTVLMPLGTDPHTFEPTPQDVAKVADAHIVFINGGGLELFLEQLLESVGGKASLVPVSYGIDFLRVEEGHGDEEGHGHGEYDPHVWFDPTNVLLWTSNIETTLSTLDPENAALYEANAKAYTEELRVLDAWIREQVAQLPDTDRRLVTDHTSLTYFAQRYGFEQVGAVFPGYSTLSAPSARDLAELQEAIQAYGVKAVFVGTTVNPHLAEQLAEDTGMQVVSLYTGSLSEAGGPAATYVALMRHDVSAIVAALR